MPELFLIFRNFVDQIYSEGPLVISGLIFAKTHSPSLALKRFLSHVIAWDTTCIYQQFNTQRFLSLFLYSGYF